MAWKQLLSLALAMGFGALVSWILRMSRKPRSYPLKDQLVRNRQFFAEGQDNIEKSFVIVVGLGGVGSHCVMALARSGVKKLRLIDFDEVSVSSLNRSAVATTEDVGNTKAATLKKYIDLIIPHCSVEALKVLFSLAEAPKLLGGNPDFVIDCIDNTNTKEELIAYCHQNKIPIVSSGGAGGRIDPTRLEIGDISTTKNCELIRKIRRNLHVKGIHSGIPMIFSSDHATRPLLASRDKKSSVQEEHDNVARFRTRIMPVIGTMPAIQGNAIAAYVLSKIGNLEFTPLHKDNIGRENVIKGFARLEKLEEGKFNCECDVDIEDYEMVCRDLWKWRSCFSGVHTYVEACRWDIGQKVSENNIVLLTKAELNKHVNGKLEWTQQQIEDISKKLQGYQSS